MNIQSIFYKKSSLSAFLFFLSGLTAHSQSNTAGRPISVAAANQMIDAYLSAANDGSVRSLFCDANLLRDYLRDSSVRQLKFFFAKHTTETRSTADSNRLTLVIAAIDSTENYVLKGSAPVLEELQPCPTECPDGEAGSDLLPENNRKP